jgi:hypothetical protein
MGKAISYILGNWKELTRFLEDARLPPDNNRSYAVHGIGAAMPRPGLCRVGFPRRTLTDGRYSQAVFTRAA